MTSVRAASDWCKKSLLEASTALQRRQVTAVQLTQACIDQIEATKKLNMFVFTDYEHALELARKSDARRAAGQAKGNLDGIPIGVKDLYCMENVPTTAASKILEGFVSPYESTATAKLLEEGAIPMGKLNMDEFAMGSATIYSKFGTTFNPWSIDLEDAAVVAGGSSGGSAAAVASGCCFAALGSDTGGSVRQVCCLFSLANNSCHCVWRLGLMKTCLNVVASGVLRHCGAQAFVRPRVAPWNDIVRELARHAWHLHPNCGVCS